MSSILASMILHNRLPKTMMEIHEAKDEVDREIKDLREEVKISEAENNDLSEDNYRLHTQVGELESDKHILTAEVGKLRDALDELADSSRALIGAQDALDNREMMGDYAEDHDRLMRHRNLARHDFDEVIARYVADGKFLPARETTAKGERDGCE